MCRSDSPPPAAEFKYRESVLGELARHGVRPTPRTPPELIREFVNDLYLFEIRRLRKRMRAGAIPKSDYASHVAELRGRYPLLALPTQYWTED